jgi:hypothetical protein
VQTWGEREALPTQALGKAGRFLAARTGKLSTTGKERPRFGNRRASFFLSSTGTATVDLMRHCISLDGSFFNTQRMVQQYVAKACLSWRPAVPA